MHRSLSRPFVIHVAAMALLVGGGVSSLGDEHAAVDRSAKSPEEATAALATKVAKLIEQLDAASLAEREAAERALIALGPEALDVLPRGTTKLSAEVKQRLVRVRQQLELAFAKSAAKASLITIPAGERPLSEVLWELTKQGNAPLVDARRESSPTPPGDPRIRVAFDNTPFWQALDKTLDAADVSLSIRDARGEVPLQLAVVPKQEGQKPRSTGATYRGPFRFEVVSTDIKKGSGDGGDLLRVVLETAWEPRSKPISLTLSGGEMTAVDDRDRSLTLATPMAQWTTSSLGGQGSVRFTLPFVAFKGDAKSLKLKGRMSALLSGANVVFRFEHLGAAARPGAVASRKIADATVRVESFRRHNDEWHIRVRTIYDNPQEAVQSHFDWLYQSRAVIVDGDDVRKPSEYDAQAAEDGVIATYAFKAKAGDEPGELTLLYTTPAVIMTMPFDFELADIKVPR